MNDSGQKVAKPRGYFRWMLSHQRGPITKYMILAFGCSTYDWVSAGRSLLVEWMSVCGGRGCIQWASGSRVWHVSGMCHAVQISALLQWFMYQPQLACNEKKCPGMSDAIQLVTAVDGWTVFIPGTLVTANTLQIGKLLRNLNKSTGNTIKGKKV